MIYVSTALLEHTKRRMSDPNEVSRGHIPCEFLYLEVTSEPYFVRTEEVQYIIIRFRKFPLGFNDELW